jgi:hypothetical protein
MNFTLARTLRVGIAMGTDNVPISVRDTTVNVIKYNMVIIDLIQLNLVADYTVIFDDGTGIIVRCAVSCFNIGGEIAIRDLVIDDYTFGTLNLIPLAITPSLLIDSGRHSVGLGLYLNPYNFVIYRFAQGPIFGSTGEGLKAFDKTIDSFGISLYFSM